MKILALKKSKLAMSAEELREALGTLKLKGIVQQYTLKGDDLRIWVDPTRAEMLLDALDTFDEYNIENNPTPKRRTGD